MKKPLLIISTAVLLFSSCAQEFNQVYKSDNVQYKYEYAKECFAKGKYVRAITLLQELVTLQKGTENAQESLYMLAMAEYNSKDYETAAQYFKILPIVPQRAVCGDSAVLRRTKSVHEYA